MKAHVRWSTSSLKMKIKIGNLSLFYFRPVLIYTDIILTVRQVNLGTGLTESHMDQECDFSNNGSVQLLYSFKGNRTNTTQSTRLRIKKIRFMSLFTSYVPFNTNRTVIN